MKKSTSPQKASYSRSISMHIVVHIKQGESKPYFRFQLGNVYITKNILIIKKRTDSRKSFGNRCGSAPEVIQELHYLSTVLFWKNKKQLPEENNWTWVKGPVLISLAEDKIALIWSATQACFFLQALYSSLQRLWDDTKVFDSSYTTIQCSLFYEKTTPLWSQQTSFWNNWEATREARMLQVPIKETWISSGCLGLLLVCAFSFLFFFNGSVRISFRKVEIIENFHHKSARNRKVLILS